MLTAIPKSWFSWGYELFDGARPVALLDLACMREKGELLIRDRTYEIGREGLLSGAFFLRKRGVDIATATKPSALRRSFDVYHGQERYTLESATAFKRKFVLREGQRIVGSVRPKSWVSRKAVVDLPEHIPMEVQVFITWLVIILWRRDQSSC